MNASLLIVVVLVLKSCSLSEAIRPVILISGLFADEESFLYAQNFIQDIYPDAELSTVSEFYGIDSLTNLWTQVDTVYDLIRPTLESSPDGVTLIGFSQGGLVCRGIIQRYSDHNVHTFISVAAPQMGVFEVPQFLKDWFGFPDREEWYWFAYNPITQGWLSIANYWNDPFHQRLYHRSNDFLPVLNDIDEQPADFTPVKRMVLVGGPDDGIAVPWETSFFGYYPENDVSTVIPMESQELYENDLFGLKTLDESGNLIQCVIPDMDHFSWLLTDAVYTRCILPWLE